MSGNELNYVEQDGQPDYLEGDINWGRFATSIYLTQVAVKRDGQTRDFDVELWNGFNGVLQTNENGGAKWKKYKAGGRYLLLWLVEKDETHDAIHFFNCWAADDQPKGATENVKFNIKHENSMKYSDYRRKGKSGEGEAAAGAVYTPPPANFNPYSR